MYEFVRDTNDNKKKSTKAVNILTASVIANGVQTEFSVGQTIGTLFSVSINGLAQQRDLHFSHTNYTSKITFSIPPQVNDVITIQFYPGKNSVIFDNTGKLIFFTIENFTYDGTQLNFIISQSINSVLTLEINGLAEEEGLGYDITDSKEVTLLYAPLIGSKVMISYFY